MGNQGEDVDLHAACDLARVREARRDHDAPGLEVDGEDALLDEREREPGVEPQDVVRDAGLDLGDAAELAPALLLDREADEVEDVAAALLGLGELARGQPRGAAPRSTGRSSWTTSRPPPARLALATVTGSRSR